MERIDDDELRRWLREDAPHGDLTTRTLRLGSQPGRLQFQARGAMCVAVIEEAARLFELCGCEAVVVVPSGSDAAPGETLLKAEGPADGLLLAWKVAQTAVEAASGIASEAARIVALLRTAGFSQPLACTRKNWPGGRALAARGVWAGGAVMHRLGLSETLLVFPEHRAFLAPADVMASMTALRAAQPEKKLVVEVGSEDEAMGFARAGAEVLQLERFSPAALAALRRRLDAEGLRPLLAPAGGVTAANALDYATAGADFLVSSAPYFAPPADVKVFIGPPPSER
ncbi:MAG: ModD protein [Pseudomonadota bacterium]|nr:ModD protein [Pseudomonadota bacterium]